MSGSVAEAYRVALKKKLTEKAEELARLECQVAAVQAELAELADEYNKLKEKVHS